MAHKRWLAPWAGSDEKPAIYHTCSRIVDRRFAFGVEDKEQFRIYMRMMENFSGCRVLSYCLMCNHFHLLLEVPPKSTVPLSDADLLKRIGGLYPKAFVAEIAKELAAAREVVKQGLAPDGEAYVHRIHERFTYRMENLSEFMKTLLQRFTRWHNRKHERRGNLWEETFKSVIVEDGLAARTMAAYIDLNPVRAGMVERARDHLWSSHGHYIGLQQDRLITPHPLVWGLGNTPFSREAAYAELVQGGPSAEDTQALTDATLKGWALGSADFVADLQRLTERRAARLMAGRPVASSSVA